MDQMKNDVPDHTHADVLALLNAWLTDSMNLMQQAKKASWKVQETTCTALHTLFDGIVDAAEESLDLLAAREAAPTIVALRQWAETTRREELDTALARIGPLEERQRRALEAFSMGLVQKLLHVPTVNLKRSFREGRALEYVQLVRHLFALDP